MAKLSVIIPVYNAEKFLEKCVDSVLNQTLADMEIILVNDGSKDGSGQLCDKLAQKDSRIKVVHQENQGACTARNNGLKIAEGEFVGFVDSDDYIKENMFEELLQQAQKDDSDVVMCDAVTVYDNGHTEPDTISQLGGDTLLQKKDLVPALLMAMAGAAWRCVYKKALLDKAKIEFPKGIKFSEDRIFNILAFGFANKVSYIKRPLYCRYVNSESVVHKFDPNYFEHFKKAKIKTEEAIEIAWENADIYKKTYLTQFIQGSLMAINNYYYKTSTFSQKEKKLAVVKLCNDKVLQEALEKKGSLGRQEKWLKNKNFALLILRAKLSNLKNGR